MNRPIVPPCRTLWCFPGLYNSNLQILQTADHVVLLTEMIHDARIVPLDGRPHMPRHVTQWLGNSRGRWEDTTLVVETTNFSDKSSYRGSAAQSAPCRALQSSRCEHARVSGHGDRPHDLEEPVDDDPADGKVPGTRLRVCLPRGQLRPAEYVDGGTRRRTGRCGRRV